MKLNRFATYAWIALFYNLAVIIWGAFVRATLSGDGCGSHWPLCNGEVMPHTGQTATLIEWTHRLTSGLSLVLILVLVYWAFRAYPRKHRVRLGAALAMFFILTEALVGAGLVLFQLVARNASVARALFMAVHLTNTFFLLAALALTAWWSSGGQFPNMRKQGAMGRVFGAGLLGTLILAVSGAVAALGDTLFPASSLWQGFQQDFSPASHFLLRLRFLHPTIAVAVGAYLIFIARLAHDKRPGIYTRRLSWMFAALLLAQLGAGALNVILRAPIWLQLFHLLMSNLIWVVLVLLSAAALSDGTIPLEEV